MRRSLLLLSCCLLWVAACSSRERPVAKFSAQPARLVLPYPGFTKLEIKWVPRVPLTGAAGPVTVFVHLLSGPGEVARTFDHPLPASWRVGQEIDDEVELYQSALGPPLAAGSYRLTVGLYDKSGRRWSLSGGEPVGRDEYLAALVEVPAPDRNRASFNFVGDWGNPEAGSDRQILARRWLLGKGELDVGRLTGAADLLVGFEIPTPTPGSEEMVFNGSSTAPTLFIDSTCKGPEVSVSGQGLQWVHYPIEPDANGRCVLDFRTNFKIVARDRGADRSIALSALALAPGSSPEEGAAER